MVTNNSSAAGSGIASNKAVDISEEMIEAARRAAEHHGVCSSLHEGDQLLGYFINQLRMDGKDSAESYINHGHGDAARIARLAARLEVAGNPLKVLEFASGFGRVTRHLKSMLPKNTLVASDIHKDACVFIEQEIGVLAKPSAINPAELDVGTNYSLIFVLSLFSHLPSHTFGQWLKSLYDITAPGGYLMFTTHGQDAVKAAPDYFGSFQYEEPGFAYRRETDQTDINSDDYGTTIALPRYVARVIDDVIPGARLVSFSAEKWFGLQDEWIIQKPASS